MRIIIADTSCLILFKKIGELEIIRNTFSEIHTTDKVISEYGEDIDWITVRNDYDINTYSKLKSRFGVGESSCIALAQGEENPLLIIDDRKARNVAEEIGIECIGSLGLLILAKREGKIELVKPIINKIKSTNFRLTEELINFVLEIVDEDN